MLHSMVLIRSVTMCVYVFQVLNALGIRRQPESTVYQVGFIFLRGTQRQFSENICSKEDLRSRFFGTFVV